ncbi:phosphoenolpyruvate carboxylase [Halalkalicoccus salilacus]|uniref:phosphoenolpyruvate carboxylase n=1 Tax=Halalkalicoccus TaxID=332246 RepID=UPI0036137AF9
MTSTNSGRHWATYSRSNAPTRHSTPSGRSDDSYRLPAGDRKSRQSLTNAIADAGPERRLVVARAFTTYFELINLAEERERVRTLREQAQAGVPDKGLEGLSKERATVDTETAHQVLDDVLVQPTFTVIRRSAPQDRQSQTPGHCERPRDARRATADRQGHRGRDEEYGVSLPLHPVGVFIPVSVVNAVDPLEVLLI